MYSNQLIASRLNELLLDRNYWLETHSVKKTKQKVYEYAMNEKK